MSNAMTACVPNLLEAAMRHDPAAGAIVIMLRSLKMYGMAQDRVSRALGLELHLAIVSSNVPLRVDQREAQFHRLTVKTCKLHGIEWRHPKRAVLRVIWGADDVPPRPGNALANMCRNH